MIKKVSSSFKIISINGRSIANKVEEIEHLLLVHDPGVLVVTESWLHMRLCFLSYQAIRNGRWLAGEVEWPSFIELLSCVLQWSSRHVWKLCPVKLDLEKCPCLYVRCTTSKFFCRLDKSCFLHK